MCGMEGYKEEEMMKWRAQATNLLSKDGISTLDPTRRWEGHNNYGDRNNINRVVKWIYRIFPIVQFYYVT